MFILSNTVKFSAKSFHKECSKSLYMFYVLVHVHVYVLCLVHVHVIEHMLYKINWTVFYQKGNFFQFCGNYVCESITNQEMINHIKIYIGLIILDK